MLNNSTLAVIVRNKDKILYDGKAFAVTAINDKGTFDVLAKHENFIAVIKDKVIIHTTPKEKQEIQIENGVVRVYQDKVYIYINFKG
jgi:F0F1-type ATP synthase epsilon subunit